MAGAECEDADDVPEGDLQSIESKYEITEAVLGEGTYGKVFKAKNRSTNENVAIKKMLVDWDEEGCPSTVSREIALLKALAHRNIVQLIDVFDSRRHIVLVFEFLDSDLKKFMRLHQNNLGPENIWKLSIQLCLGIEFCHAHSVLHRDLKPQNLLIDHRQKELTLKLADFGLARQFDNPARRYTPEVVTVWYRAPELLLGSGLYSAPLDMWGVGCIIAEMAVGRPLFDGDSEIDTIFRIFRTLGTPSEARWPDVKHLPYFEKKKYPMWPEKNWAKDHAGVLQQLASGGVDLVASCLVYDPKRRLPAKKAVKHQYFQIESASQRSQITPQKDKEKAAITESTDKRTPEKVAVSSEVRGAAEANIAMCDMCPKDEASEAPESAPTSLASEDKLPKASEKAIEVPEPVLALAACEEKRPPQAGPPMKRLRVKSKPPEGHLRNIH